MEYRTPKSILILLICWGLSTTALRGVASAAGSAGTSGADFLEIGVGSRPLGMGEAFTAGTDDINSIYYNPAGLGTIRYPVLSIMHQELILDSRFENISAAFPLFYGFMGVSNSVFWVPPFDKIDVDGNKTGTVNFYNACFTLAYGQSLGFMEVGGSVKYIHQKIDTLTLHSAAVDLGVMKRLYMYSPFDAPIRNFVLGMSLQNIGTKAKDDELPRLMRMGASYYPTRWLGLNLDLMQYFIDTSDLYDFTYGFEESLRANLGMELSYFNIIALRAGYRFNDSGTYSLGMGFNYAVKDVGFSIDASYSDTGIFGPVYSFSISFKLIPKIITVEDQLKAEAHYQKAIKYYIANDIDSALDEFRSCRDYNPYHKNVKKKIKDLEYLKELKRQNEELDKRKTF
ncbi:MAG: PorV/PorQ family protein [Spirochaetota bacterium]